MSAPRFFRPCTIAILWFAAAILPLLSPHLSAQNRPSSRGKEFWVGFMPGVFIGPGEKFILTIVADRPTRGTVSYTRTGRREEIAIPSPEVPLRLVLGEGVRVNPSRTETAFLDSGTVHLLFDDDVSVYALMTQPTDGDAFLALPTEALGTEYVVLGYPNSPPWRVPSASDLQSQCAVIATEDSTRVDDAPSADGGSFSVMLNRGEMYIRRATGPYDVSGSIITASKPVVVYGGHHRANVPYDTVTGLNYLVEQLPPVRSWGTGFHLAPTFMPNQTVMRPELVRVVAAEDGTDLKIGGQLVKTIGRGDVYQMPLEQGAYLTASRPVLVAQFHPSSPLPAGPSSPADSIGDPFMMLVPPELQFDTLYRVESFAVPDFSLHYITVVIPYSARETLVLDGAPLSPAALMPISGTGYGYAHIKVEPGLHTVHASVPFGLSVYGYGWHNAYGYPGGMILHPPVVAVGDEKMESPGMEALLAANPVTGQEATLRITLPDEERIGLEILDMRGRLVARPVLDRALGAGESQIVFSTASLPAGAYFCRVVAGSCVRTLRMIVVR